MNQHYKPDHLLSPIKVMKVIWEQMIRPQIDEIQATITMLGYHLDTSSAGVPAIAFWHTIYHGKNFEICTMLVVLQKG